MAAEFLPAVAAAPPQGAAAEGPDSVLNAMQSSGSTDGEDEAQRAPGSRGAAGQADVAGGEAAHLAAPQQLTFVGVGEAGWGCGEATLQLRGCKWTARAGLVLSMPDHATLAAAGGAGGAGAAASQQQQQQQQPVPVFLFRGWAMQLEGQQQAVKGVEKLDWPAFGFSLVGAEPTPGGWVQGPQGGCGGQSGKCSPPAGHASAGSKAPHLDPRRRRCCLCTCSVFISTSVRAAHPLSVPPSPCRGPHQRCSAVRAARVRRRAHSSSGPPHALRLQRRGSGQGPAGAVGQLRGVRVQGQGKRPVGRHASRALAGCRAAGMGLCSPTALLAAAAVGPLRCAGLIFWLILPAPSLLLGAAGEGRAGGGAEAAQGAVPRRGLLPARAQPGARAAAAVAVAGGFVQAGAWGRSGHVRGAALRNELLCCRDFG